MGKSVSNIGQRFVNHSSDVARDFFNGGTVKKTFRMGYDIFSAVVPVIEKPTPLNFVKAGFTIGKIIVDDLEIWTEDYFDETWQLFYNENFTQIILKALHNKPYKIIRTSDETLLIHIVDIDNIRFGYLLNTKVGKVDRIYVKGDALVRAKEIIKAELWKTMKNSNIILRATKTIPTAYEMSVSLEVDDTFDAIPSKRADEYSQYLKKCIDAGVTRSVMLYGPSGTGKSTIARTIVNNLGLKSLRIRVEDFGRLETSTIFEAIDIFEPDAVILDDFDRTNEQNSLLEVLEYFQRHVKLVISTVNNKNKLDEAILRPGRFDELIHVKQMDEDVVRSILGDKHEEDFELLKNWPIAFINEYVKRLRFMNHDAAKRSVKELASRVKKLSSFDDDEDDIDKVLKPQVKVSKASVKSKDSYSNQEDTVAGWRVTGNNAVSKESFRSKRNALSRLFSTKK